MSLRVRRGAKAAALGLVAMNNSAAPDPIGSAALRMMKIGLEPGLASGYAGGARAAACVSVDFDVTSPERFPWNHDGTEALLRLSEAHGLPLTWAICGKTAVDDPRAYESILASSVRQEIGVHTYSHIYADETTEEAYEQDIERCIEVLQVSKRPSAFVFPKNREGHFGLLRRMGFKSYRGKNRIIGAPISNQGLWNIMPVYYVDPKSLLAAALLKRFVDVCVARSAVFHLWTHPWSLAIDGKVERMASDVMEPVFQHMEEKSRSGLLSLATMGSLSEFMGSSS
jgi:peptidoglycan/xylan/chitin deacetylase (PgdA/CDA1 family)